MKPDAGKRKPRGKARLIEGRCIACGERCLVACPAEAIVMDAKGEPIIDAAQCIGCAKCVKVCPADALEMAFPEGTPGKDAVPILEPVEGPRTQQIPIPGSGGVWVFVEQDQGAAHPVSWELLGVGRTLADELGVELCAFVLGAAMTDVVQQAIGYGADKLYLVDDPVLGRFRTEPYRRATVALIRKYRPEVVLLGATGLGRDLAGAVATELSTGLTADCTGLAIDRQRRLLEQTRPAFGGNIMATILTETARPQMATVRPHVMPCPPFRSGRTAAIVSERLDLREDEITAKILEWAPLFSEGMIDIAAADILVSGGRGMMRQENFRLLEELAQVLGGTVAATRGAVSAGWMPHGRQVGQTGKTVRPRLYVACGISGAIQHLVGMQDSERIIAINKDSSAPIFEVAHLGIVGDALEIVPALIEKLRHSKAQVIPRRA